MIIDIIKIILASSILSFPLAALNASIFHNKSISFYRLIFIIIAAFLVSSVISSLCVMMKHTHSDWGFIFYIFGLFLCTPYFITSRLKECTDNDHLVDFVGIIVSIGTYAVVIFQWDSFFSNPAKAGFVYEIADFIYMLFRK